MLLIDVHLRSKRARERMTRIVGCVIALYALLALWAIGHGFVALIDFIRHLF